MQKSNKHRWTIAIFCKRQCNRYIRIFRYMFISFLFLLLHMLNKVVVPALLSLSWRLTLIVLRPIYPACSAGECAQVRSVRSPQLPWRHNLFRGQRDGVLCLPVLIPNIYTFLTFSGLCLWLVHLGIVNLIEVSNHVGVSVLYSEITSSFLHKIPNWVAPVLLGSSW